VPEATGKVFNGETGARVMLNEVIRLLEKDTSSSTFKAAKQCANNKQHSVTIKRYR
jgi:hypothetical protein